MEIIRAFLITALLLLGLTLPAFSQATGSISGIVRDSFAALVTGATVTVIDSADRERTVTTSENGTFTVTGLASGKYTVKVFAEGFALYDNSEVNVVADKPTELLITLSIDDVDIVVDVETGVGVSVEPEDNLGAIVLGEKEIAELPEDPDELLAALQALAGPTGPEGGQIFIDGFSGGQMPPRESIMAVRINQNPFSAEYDRIGFGRIEIVTRPGSDRWRGSANFNFNDARMNSRNPFSINRAPGQTKNFGGNISGPLQKGKSSFFLNINQRMLDENSVVNAQILDPMLNVIPFQQEFQVPVRSFNISPRLDYAINQNNSLVFRYSYNQNKRENQGLGDTSLPSRGFNSEGVGHDFRITETMIINPTTVNETRFQYEFNENKQFGDNSIPSINVSAAFAGGGAQVGQSFNRNHRIELNNFTTTSLGKNNQHSIRFGGRLRYNNITNRSESGFGGSFTFTGTPDITPLEQYRGNIQGLGNSDERFLPTQFNITTGNPEIGVKRTDYGIFITDDWRINPNFTLSFGLRYENQTNISDNSNFAPRLSFAWAPFRQTGQSRTVIRGGAGIFYDRFSENLTLQALRFNGINQLNLSVNLFDPDPDRRAAAALLLSQPVFTIDGVSNVPTAAQILAVLPQSNIVRSINPDIKSPLMTQYTMGVDHQFSRSFSLSAYYIGSRTNNVLRARNINAPICPLQIDCENAPRPIPDGGNIYEYESTGRANQNRFQFSLNSVFNQYFTLRSNYSLSFANSDTDGAGSFPAYSYDLSGEWGRTAWNTRHTLNFFGSITAPYGFSLTPFVTFNSGRSFNITRGVDLNGDSLTTERPTFGELAARCAELNLTHSFCDVAGYNPNDIIPRNFGDGPKFFSFNTNVSRNFGFGKSPEPTRGAGDDSAGQAGGPAGGMGGMRGGRGGGGGRGGMGGGFGGNRKPYNLNLSVNFNNLFNTVNYNSPVSNLNSFRFGQYTSSASGRGFGGFGGGGGGGFGGGGAANRRIEFSARFNW